MIVVGLTATSLVLGFSSYWRCINANNPTFIAPLLWTVSLVKGGLGDVSLLSGELKNGKLCPEPTPTALEVARLTIVVAIFISLAGVAAAAFRAQSDRLRAVLGEIGDGRGGSRRRLGIDDRRYRAHTSPQKHPGARDRQSR